MPPQPVISNWIRLVVHAVHENSTMLYIYNFKRETGTVNTANLIALCQEFWTSFGPNIAQWTSNSYTFALVEATDRSVVGGAYGAFVPTTNSIGLVSGDALPANVACCVSLKTGFSGRSRRGRQYIFGFVDAHFNGSTIIAGIVSLMGTYVQTVIQHNWTGALQVVWSVASIKNLALYPINSFAIDYIGDSQRRRLPGRGF